MKTLLEQVENNRRVIKHEVLTFSLSELVNMYLAKPQEVNINPNFQRLFRWTREQQSSFLESLILEIPIPPGEKIGVASKHLTFSSDNRGTRERLAVESTADFPLDGARLKR